MSFALVVVKKLREHEVPAIDKEALDFFE